MILADTTVVVDFLRAPIARLVSIVQSYQAAICSVTISEIYAGARAKTDFKKYDKSLSVFSFLPIRKKTWLRLGRNLSQLRANGLTVPFQDALIATVGIENDVEVWTHDRHFVEMQRVLTKLALFQEPP